MRNLNKDQEFENLNKMHVKLNLLLLLLLFPNFTDHSYKMHVKLNLLLLLLLFPNFTDHSYDISQKLPRVQCTVNSNG